MCEVNGPRLLAWMDGEIEGREGEEIAAHVQDCAECAASLRRFCGASAEVLSYRDRLARGAERAPMRQRHWIRVAAIAAVVMLAVLISRGVRGIDTRNAAAPVPLEGFARGAGIIRVAVPIDEVLPPGVVPAGINLQADLVLAVDGTPTAIRLAP